MRIATSFLFFFLFIATSCNNSTSADNATEKDPFIRTLKNLEQTKYKYELNRIEEVPKNKTFLNTGLNFINNIRTKRNIPIVDTLSMIGIVKIRQAFILGTVPIFDQTVPRAEVEEWEFETKHNVMKALGTIERIKALVPWKQIKKPALECWGRENKLYFFAPHGFYMDEESAFLLKTLKENL